jgi:hypothetical protein
LLVGSTRRAVYAAETGPWDHHRPGLNTAHAIDSLFQRETRGKRVIIERKGFGYFTVNFERPWIGFHAACVGRGIGFIQTKLIEIVIARYFIFRRQRQRVLPLGRFAEL